MSGHTIIHVARLLSLPVFPSMLLPVTVITLLNIVPLVPEIVPVILNDQVIPDVSPVNTNTLG